MKQIKSFSDFNIKTERFTGKSIEIEEVLDQQILVVDYKISPSKFKGKGNDQLLTLQIKFEEKERIIFTGSVILQEQCAQIKESGEFPCTATIIALKPRGFKFV